MDDYTLLIITPGPDGQPASRLGYILSLPTGTSSATAVSLVLGLTEHFTRTFGTGLEFIVTGPAPTFTVLAKYKEAA